ncbi:MAG: hypothetical protein A4E55_01746 [Pelotomaculum sp. PtaU1.Bin035]|nr:MAG: hypothetical protein A4E55_01746 [Pelotomaculum sp. PtaU1.Bin035]
MIEMFVKFLGDFGLRVFDKISKLRSKKSIYLKKYVQFFISINRVYIYLCNFFEFLQKWKCSNYSTKYSTDCESMLKNIYTSLLLLNSDVQEMIILEELDLSKDIFRILDTKCNVFRIWKTIMKNNAYCGFCSLENEHLYAENDSKTLIGIKRIIYIPNYSVLLNGIKSTAELENTTISYYEYNKTKPFDILFDLFHLNRERHNNILDNLHYNETLDSHLHYLPELPLEDDISNGSCYMIPNSVKKIVLPDQENKIDEIIKTTGEAIEQFREIIEKLREILRRYIDKQNSYIDILEYL